MSSFTQENLNDFKEALEESTREDLIWAVFFGLGITGTIVYFASTM